MNKDTKRSILEDRVQHIDLEEVFTIKDLMSAYQDTSIQSRALARCAQVYEGAL